MFKALSLGLAPLLMTAALGAPAFMFSIPEASALPIKEPRRYCNCGCQYKKDGKWIDAVGISINFGSEGKCSAHDGNAITRCRGSDGARTPGRLSNCSITGFYPNAPVPKDGGVVEQPPKRPGAVVPTTPPNQKVR
jgi:hypothetical protein